MFRFASIFIIVIFALWLLPLGAFIKPSQEKIACGGQRAICLCSHMKAGKVSSQAIESGAALKTGTSAGQDKEPAGGASHYFSVASLKNLTSLRLSAFSEDQYLCVKDPFLASLEHVPKV